MGLIKAAILAILLIIGVGNEGNNEVLEEITCNVETLEEHSFEQLSEFPEYVCVNIEDYTDFVIIYDLYDEMNVGNVLEVGLNEHDEVITYNKIK